MLNKTKGNMYPWITHTWNPIKGKCSHKCSYCYYQNNPRFKSIIGELRLNEKCLKDNLGEGNIIFVGSSTDMFAKEVPYEWIKKVLDYCKKFDNKYLFQSKNPERMYWFYRNGWIPSNSILGTTIESNREYNISKAPSISDRVKAMKKLKRKI